MNYTEELKSKGYLIEFEKEPRTIKVMTFFKSKTWGILFRIIFHLVILLVITSHGIMERIVVERVVNGKLMMKNWFVNT